MPRLRRRQRPSKSQQPKTRFPVPFHDRGRPNPPYILGSYWLLQAHVPLPPYGRGYEVKHRRGPAALEEMRRMQLPQSAYCLLNPPQGPEPPADTPQLTVEVVEALRVEVGRGAQVAVCRVVNGDVPGLVVNKRELVAKIYDPLYYFYNGDHDIIELADMEYCREVAAYEHLEREGVAGQLVPAFHGAYTMDVPLTQEQREILACLRTGSKENADAMPATRRVRLTLVDKARGEVMTHQLVWSDVRAMPASVKMEAIGTSMEAYARLYQQGLVHGDMAPRNIFLQTVPGEMVSVTHASRSQLQYRKFVFSQFVDLGLAYVLGNAELKSAFPRQSAREQRPRNPIRLFWNVLDSGASNMYHWLPDDLCNTKAFQTWMLQRWYGDPRFESIGPEPLPCEDETPWYTGKAVKVLAWPDDDEDEKEEGGNGSEGGNNDGSGSGTFPETPKGFW